MRREQEGWEIEKKSKFEETKVTQASKQRSEKKKEFQMDKTQPREKKRKGEDPKSQSLFESSQPLRSAYQNFILLSSIDSLKKMKWIILLLYQALMGCH